MRKRGEAELRKYSVAAPLREVISIWVEITERDNCFSQSGGISLRRGKDSQRREITES